MLDRISAIYASDGSFWTALKASVEPSTYATWASVGAELLVALVIYWEFAQQRQENFITEFNKQYWDRKDIYEAFAREDKDIKIVREEFATRLFEEAHLRGKCDQQIDHLSALWRSHGTLGQRALLKWFPHTVAKMWVMLGPYVLRKVTMNGGAWGDQNFIDFARSAMKLLCHQKVISMEISSGTVKIPISKELLVAILAAELKP